MLHFPSMPRPLRVLTGLAIAQLVMGVLVLLLADANLPAVLVARNSGRNVVVAWPVLVAASLILVGAWTYVLAGAVRMHGRVAFPVLAVAAIIWKDLLASPIRQPAAPLALIGLLLYFLLRKAYWRRVPLMADVVTAGVLAGILNFSALWSVSPAGAGIRLQDFADGISSQAIKLIYVLVPLLVMAGVDLAELSTEISAWLVEAVLEPVAETVVAGGVILLAVIKIALRLRAGVPPLGGLVAAMGVLVFAGLVAYTLRRHDWRAAEPSFGLLLALSVLLFAVPALASLTLGLLPRIMTNGAVAFVLSDSGVPASWALAGMLAIGTSAALLRIRFRSGRPSGSLLYAFLFGAWVLATVGNPLLLANGGSGEAFPMLLHLPELDLVGSCAAVGAALAMLLARKLDRRRLAFVAMVLVGLSALTGIDDLYAHDLAVTDLVALAQLGLFLAVAFIGCVRIMQHPSSGPTARRWAVCALVASVATAGAGLLVLLASHLGVLPNSYQLPKAWTVPLVLGLALSWDLMMSGRRFTNHHTPRMPRDGRVLLYVGYILLLVAALLWARSLHSGTSELEILDENALPDLGIVVLGLPLVLYGWILGARRLWSV